MSSKISYILDKIFNFMIVTFEPNTNQEQQD